MIGTSISHYRITRELGQGGMGSVYLATDLVLNRSVALKLLRPELAARPDLLDRFLREARAAASLNHPNIASIHELGEADGLRFITMEFVDGQSLKDILALRRLSTAEALDIACQVCDALIEAHSKGITHRDIKPGNVMVTARGRVKVLDFGLAKVDPCVAWDHSDSTAIGDRASTPGAVVGTFHYMSPEQALGRHVDARSDVFSLGVVLFEMSAGRLPFTGQNWAELNDQILHADPVLLSAENPAIPAQLDAVIAKALAKNRDSRYSSAAEMAGDLRALSFGSHPLIARLPVRRMSSARRRALAGVACLLLTGAAVFSVWKLTHRTSFPPPVMVTFTSFDGAEMSPAFSPEGTTLAYAWNTPAETNFNIYLQVIGAGEPQRLTSGTASNTDPVFSPDGRFVAFTRNGKELYLIPRIGGKERKIADVEDRAVDFAPDGKSIATGGPTLPDGRAVGLSLVSIDTGEKKPLTTPPPGYCDSFPRFSPEGRRVAFRRSSQPSIGELYVQSLDSGKAVRLTDQNRSVDGIAWAADGESIIFGSNRNGPMSLWRIPASGGTSVEVPQSGLGASLPAVARQGHRLAYHFDHTDTNIWRVPLTGAGRVPEEAVKFASSTRIDASPDFSPDGRQVAFASNRGGFDEIYVADSDGVSVTRLTSFSDSVVGSPSWSPDGKWIAFDARVKGNGDIYLIESGGGQPRRLTFDPATDVAPTWSRDGKWIYFTSRRGGRPEVWKVSPNGGQQIQVTRNGGFRALESPDSQTLYFTKQREQAEIWSVPVVAAKGAGLDAAGGDEKLAVRHADGTPVRVHQFSYWTVTREGIYFVEQPAANPGAPVTARSSPIQFFSFASGAISTVAQPPRPPWPFTGGLAVSPDGRFALFTQLDQRDSDIIFLENFR